MAAGLAVDVRHRRGDFELSAAFEAPPGVTALFGRSGSGKTTMVDAVAGLLRPDRARIVVGDAVLTDTATGTFVPPHRRRLGYVFQEGRLFPHLTVRQNLLFGRVFARRDGGEEGPSLGDVLALLGIAPLLDRRPGALSGGEKQRVAIGRALLARPRLLLMDEPLAALDEARKEEILPYLARLRDLSRLPVLYVSHSVGEVARLADTVVMLDGGKVVACGPAASVFSDPVAATRIAGRAAGAVLEAEIAGQDDGLTRLATAAGPLLVPALSGAVGSRLRVRIAARDVMLALERPRGISALNMVDGTVEDLVVTGPTALVRVACGGERLLAEITARSASALAIAPGRPVVAIIKSATLQSGRDDRDGAGLTPPMP